MKFRNKVSIVVKRQGHAERFDERKVYGSVYAACASAYLNEARCEKTAEEVTKKINRFIKTKKKIRSSEIRSRVAAELRKKGKDLEFFYEHHLPNLKKL